MRLHADDKNKGLDNNTLQSQDANSTEANIAKTADTVAEVSGQTKILMTDDTKAEASEDIDIPMADDSKAAVSDDEFSDYELIDCESGEEANGDEDEEIRKFLCEHAPQVRKALDDAARRYGPIIRAQIAEDKAKKAADKAAKVQQAEKERRARFTPDEIAKRRRKNEKERARRKRNRALLVAKEEAERKERKDKILQKIKQQNLQEGEESDVEFILE